jgi:hypothetical protein
LTGIDLGAVTGATGDFSIADKIVHTGDTNTAIRFPSADTVTVETGGSERARVDSSGRLLLGAGAIATPKSSGAGGLDLDNGSISLVVGGNENSTGRTDGTSKINRIAAPHRTNSEEPVAMFSCQASTSTNTLFYGGGSSYTNAVTEHKFYTAADTTTTTGTQRLRIRSNGEIQVGVLDTPSASRGALGIKASSDAQSVPINLYLQESSGGEGYGIGVDGDGDLNFYNGGATTASFEIGDDNNVTVTQGNFIMGTSGKGISFAATGGPTNGTGSSELLDDYEEGTFSPLPDAGGGVSFTYAHNKGFYTKIGNTVTFQLYLMFYASSISSGNAGNGVAIQGLPYTIKNDDRYNPAFTIGRTYNFDIDSDQRIYAYGDYNSTNIRMIIQTDDSTGSILTAGQVDQSTCLTFISGTYQI